jgi:hypothetical protein
MTVNPLKDGGVETVDHVRSDRSDPRYLLVHPGWPDSAYFSDGGDVRLVMPPDPARRDVQTSQPTQIGMQSQYVT